MIISKTPYRISFFGGGTDFPDWFLNEEGAVLSTSIDKYCYISLRKLPPFFSHKHRIVYSDIELTKDLIEIKHPSVRECLKLMNVTDGLEIHHDGDLPSRSGLGSSSSFTIGLLHALKAYQGQMISHEKLCELGILVERNLIGEAGGIQDQIAVTHGGFNHITFNSDGYTIKPIIAKPAVKRELELSLCLFFTGKSRISEQIEKKKLQIIHEKHKELSGLVSLVNEGIKCLTMSSFDAKSFGGLLHENWTLKKELAKEVSNPEMDDLYDLALRSGAYGGKILGAGGGGFLLFCIDSYNRASFIDKIPILHVPFRFENSGSRIIVYN